MRIANFLAAAAATSLAAAPVLAAPTSPTASLSDGKSVRAGSHSKHKDDLLGGGFGAIIAAVIVVGVGVGVGVAVSQDDNSPSSP